MKLLLIILSLFICSFVFAKEVIVGFEDKDLPVLNEVLRDSDDRIRKIENGVSLTTGVTGILPVTNGGTGLPSATDDTVLVGNGGGYTPKILPDCETATSKIDYDQTTNTFSCGTTEMSEVDEYEAGATYVEFAS